MTQLYLLKTIFAKSKEEISKFSKISNERLLSSANALYEILDNHKIPYIKAWSAIFVFVDLSRFLDENTYDGEKKLQSKLFNELKVLFTPGKDCHAPCPGWFRVCMAAVPIESLVEAIRRITSKFCV